jgi:transcription antitermination factor NusG
MERRFRRGERVLVAVGPLTGMEGIFHAEKGEDRVLILLNFLGRQNTVVMKATEVVPVC